MPELTVHELTKNYGTHAALQEVSFTVRDGSFFTLLGPSGCGKSTTLASIAGLERPDHGRIAAGSMTFLDSDQGVYLTPEERNLGMVFQSYALWPHMTVAGNLELPLKLRRVSGSERARRIDRTLEQVGLGPFRDRYPHQLSGGQQQRVALARALVYSPDVLLLDEPLSNLDAKLREQARGWLKQLQQDVGITTIYVTHDQAEALTLSDQIAVMRRGRMLQVGSPEEIYERPTSPAVADFVGRCNFLAGTIDQLDERQATIALGAGTVRIALGDQRSDPSLIRGSRVTLGIRAERLRVVDHDHNGDNVLRAGLQQRLYSGSTYEYRLSYQDQTLVAEDTCVVDGPEVGLVIDPDTVSIFPGEPDRELLHPSTPDAASSSDQADRVEVAV
ncbi:ABC transporter ATP-binding protein [Microlunatus soli]|uniref:ABC-type quaternary amine transporter n=1 Tax=Microlunatus soli TaxID=630515 RepID=A0A1H1PCG0_9ACTN|nr:ABC transporter ATP-binding protein [Microlunatus soli]SDS08988.1 iron(III) transport system ATP-binding protein [Microlunatus soli]